MARIGRKDLKVLRGMTDAETFDEEAFGFHAQQAVEKALKSWISLRNREYPHTHDLGRLINILESQGEDCGRFVDLADLSSFAVQFRYEDYPVGEEELDRSGIIERVAELFEHVESLCDSDEK